MSDGSSVLSVPGPQDDPGNPARLTPSYYLLNGENPGSWGVCSHSSTTFLHRVIFGVLAGIRGGPSGLPRRPKPVRGAGLADLPRHRLPAVGSAVGRAEVRTYVRGPNLSPRNRLRIVMLGAADG